MPGDSGRPGPRLWQPYVSNLLVSRRKLCFGGWYLRYFPNEVAEMGQ